MNDEVIILQLNEHEAVSLEGTLQGILAADGLGDYLKSVLIKVSEQLDAIEQDPEEEE